MPLQHAVAACLALLLQGQAAAKAAHTAGSHVELCPTFHTERCAPWRRWGNPNEERYHDYMMSYSPINNVREGVTYPAMLVVSGLNDPRVAYWEPAKWAQARVRPRPDPPCYHAPADRSSEGAASASASVHSKFQVSSFSIGPWVGIRQRSTSSTGTAAVSIARSLAAFVAGTPRIGRER